MMQKTVRVVLCTMISAAFLCTGMYAGGHLERANNEKAESKFETVQKIAVVNLDEGVFAVSSEKTYYSQSLLQFPSDNFEFTGLEMARSGISQGKYAAYILVPSTFSQSIESINNIPERAILEYSVNPNLKESVREPVLKELQVFQGNLNERITYVYISAILSAFHEVQDASGIIMNHGEKELEMIQGVQAEELLQEVDFPELKRSEYMPEYVDLDEYYRYSQDSVRETKLDAVSNVDLGLDAFNTIKGDRGALDVSADDLFEYLGEIYPGLDSEGNRVYESGLKLLNAEIDTYNNKQAQKRDFMREKLSLLSENQRISNQEYLMLRLEESVEFMQEQNDIQVASMSNAHQQFVDTSLFEIQTGNQSLVDDELQSIMMEDERLYEYLQRYIDEQFLLNAVQMREIYEQQANEQLREILDATPSDATPSDATSSDATPMSIELSDEIPSDELSAAATSSNASIQLSTPSDAAVTIDLEQSGLSPLHHRNLNIALKPAEKAEYATPSDADRVFIKLPAYQLSLERPQIILPEIDKNIFGAPVLEIEELYRISNEEVAEILEEEIIRVIAEKNTEQYTGLQLLNEKLRDDMDDYEKVLDAYNPYYYLELDMLEAPLDAIEASLREVEDTMNEKAAQDIDFTQEVYDNADENIELLQNSMESAQIQTGDNVIKTMAALKQSREELNDENMELLAEFTRKLTYTRVGSLGNTEAYDFIVTPVHVVEKSSGEFSVSSLLLENNRYLVMGILLFLLAGVIVTGNVLLTNRKRGNST